jgi:hypothetical protein
MKIKAISALAAVCAVALGAAAYEVAPVTNGGSLKGKITGKGAAGANIATTKDQQVCHANVPDESLVLGEGGSLANAIVYFVGVESGKDPAGMPAAVLANQACRYVPHVQAMMVGQELTIANSDPILHNTHTYDEAEKTVFNLALPIKDQKIKKTMKKPGLVHAKCDAGHTWMSGYIWVNDNPYYAVTDAKGMFEIKDIPAGDYTVVVWHEKLGKSEQDVSIKAGAAADLSLALGK